MRRYCDEDKLGHAIHEFVNEYGEIVGMSITDFNIMLERNRADVVPLEDYKSMERTVDKLTKAIADASPVRCKDCIHRPQWKNRELYPPGYWGDNEADIDWTCPLIDRNELRNSWYMDDDFYCPEGEES